MCIPVVQCTYNMLLEMNLVITYNVLCTNQFTQIFYDISISKINIYIKNGSSKYDVLLGGPGNITTRNPLGSQKNNFNFYILRLSSHIGVLALPTFFLSIPLNMPTYIMTNDCGNMNKVF